MGGPLGINPAHIPKKMAMGSVFPVGPLPTYLPGSPIKDRALHLVAEAHAKTDDPNAVERRFLSTREHPEMARGGTVLVRQLAKADAASLARLLAGDPRRWVKTLRLMGLASRSKLSERQSVTV